MFCFDLFITEFLRMDFHSLKTSFSSEFQDMNNDQLWFHYGKAVNIRGLHFNDTCCFSFAKFVIPLHFTPYRRLIGGV